MVPRCRVNPGSFKKVLSASPTPPSPLGLGRACVCVCLTVHDIETGLLLGVPSEIPRRVGILQTLS